MPKSKSRKAASKKRVSRAAQRDDTMANQAAQGDSMASNEIEGVIHAEEGTIVTNKLINQNTRSPLLKLPAEIKLKIWSYAVTVDEPIEPRQLRERSNKFTWSKAQVTEKGEKIVANAPTLTAVQLSRVCSTLYEEVALTHLFYKVNRFHFESSWNHLYRFGRAAVGPLTYFVALTSPRMKAIRSLTCEWSSHPRDASQLFTVLATCDGLQELTLVLHYDFRYQIYRYDSSKPEPLKIAGYKEALIAAEGLQSLSVKICPNGRCTGSYPPHAQSIVTVLESALRDRMKEPRGKTKYSLATLLKAQREAALDVHGDGRLSEDKKPGIIASRTRHQLRQLETLTDDGRIPRAPLPKYNVDGDLNWIVEEVLASRRSEPDGFPPSVEFQVKCIALIGRFQRSSIPPEVTFEDAAALNSYDQRCAIVSFYTVNPSAYGKEELIELWNLRDNDSGQGEMTATEKRNLRGLTRHIVQLVEDQKKQEEREAEERAQKATKAAKKSKKVTKGKNAVKG